MDKLVVNLSGKTFIIDQLSLLTKGLNLCLVPTEPNPGALRFDLDNLHRKLRLHCHLHEDKEIAPLLPEGGHYDSLFEFQHHKLKVALPCNW